MSERAGQRPPASTRQNLVYAAPGGAGPQRTPSDRIRAVVINSGNANACTGERGLRRRPARWPAWPPRPAAPNADQALVLSTGVIGEFLPMDKIAAGHLGRGRQAGTAAKRR